METKINGGHGSYPVVKRIEKILRTNTDFILCFIGLDRFGRFNSSLGGMSADGLIAKMHEVLIKGFGKNIVFRLWGSKFCVIVEGLKVEDAKAIEQDIRRLISSQYNHYGMSVSIGILTKSDINASNINNPETIFDMGRSILEYLAGINRTEYFNKNAYDKLLMDTYIESLLIDTIVKARLDPEKIQLFYQPIVDMHDYEIETVEALLRVKGEDNSYLPADKVIKCAAHKNLLPDLSRLILRDACLQAEKWRHGLAKIVNVSVNLPAGYFSYKGLIREVETILSDTGLPPGMLHLEITEIEKITDIQRATIIIKALQEMKVKIAVDDVGMAYGLRNVSSLPCDYAKIDRSFINGLPHEKKHTQLVESLIKTAQDQDMQIIAEGIEDNGQCDVLREMGCELGQGYLFSKPMDKESVTPLLMHGSLAGTVAESTSRIAYAS